MVLVYGAGLRMWVSGFKFDSMRVEGIATQGSAWQLQSCRRIVPLQVLWSCALFRAQFRVWGSGVRSAEGF